MIAAVSMGNRDVKREAEPARWPRATGYVGARSMPRRGRNVGAE